MKTTDYFESIRTRPDRQGIRDDWLELAIRAPLRRQMQPDGRLRCWIAVPGMASRYLRVILLADGETVHNAFFDRRFIP